MSEEPEPLVRAKRRRIEALAGELRSDLARIDDPQFRALFETAAEVLLGLGKAFADFETKEEPAWRRLSRTLLP